uniref:Uncharacterized protein n=1 Tax=Anguilla anguilla TaxID=7936 RepID=A0A0E9QPY1_ANGAN
MSKLFLPSSDRVLLLPCSAVGATTDICISWPSSFGPTKTVSQSDTASICDLPQL